MKKVFFVNLAFSFLTASTVFADGISVNIYDPILKVERETENVLKISIKGSSFKIEATPALIESCEKYALMAMSNPQKYTFAPMNGSFTQNRDDNRVTGTVVRCQIASK